jgi:hypothetical protein
MRAVGVIAALALVVLAGKASADDLPDCFLGRWRSNEALTLADMRKHPEVTPKARALFEAEFFGRLVLVNTRTRSGGYFESEQDRKALALEPIQVVSSTPTSAVIRTDLVGIAQDTEWFCEGKAIYALVSRWKFREYFTPE